MISEPNINSYKYNISHVSKVFVMEVHEVSHYVNHDLLKKRLDKRVIQ